VGTVAVQTSRTLDGITAVSGFEVRVLELMAVAAEGGIVPLQQILKRRAVGKMAGQAVLALQRLVDDPLFEVFSVMAFKAEGVPGRDQQFTVLRRMGVMTVDAPARLDGGVHNGSVHSELLF
jgi:hypothetical protein